MVRESVFFASIRAFLVTFFGLLGLVASIIVIILLLALITLSGRQAPSVIGSYTVLPNANGSKKALGQSTPLILSIDLKGVIGSDDLNGPGIEDQLERSRLGSLDDRVKAIFLNINSPGGSVFAADSIYQAVKEYKERYNVPVYAFADGLCASGAMYVSCAADQIFATAVSLVGSIGVLVELPNISETLDKIGVEVLTVSRGKDKDAMNPLRPWKEGEDEQITGIIDYYYNDFVALVTGSRKNVSRDKLVDEYGAHVFPAPAAKEIGYIDEVVATRNVAIAKLAEELGITKEYQVIRLENKNWLSSLFRAESPLITGRIVHQMKLPEALDGSSMSGYLYLYKPESQAYYR